VGAIFVLAAAVVGVVYYLRFIAPFESTDNATIEGHVVPIAPQVPGRVTRLFIQDNQPVKQGDVLLEIDASDYDTKVALARANLVAAKSKLAEAEAQQSVDQAKAEQEKASIVALEAEATRAKADLKRFEAVEIRAVSRSQVDEAQAAANSTAAQVDVARNRALAAAAQATLSTAGVETARANILQGESTLRQAELNLSYTKITAPADGRVTRRSVEPGAYVQPGQSLFALVPPEYWVVANFKETQLTRMKVGQPVTVKVDAYPGHKFKGHIDSIQAGAGARFSMFPPENATGNFIKVIQRVPVKIVFDTAPGAQFLLGPGMSAEPSVRVD
jgi:membrane fusion protein (multidrug efflux system)